MMNMHARVWGEFTLQRRTESGVLLQEVKFRNLITNLGLDLIGQGLYGFSYCRLSTSSATPAVTDTTMGGTSVTSTSSSPIFPYSVSVLATPPYTSTVLLGFRFAAGVATGTWSSIGIQQGPTDSNTMCKTRIRDGGGTPTSITVLASEVLDVRYEFRTEIDTADVVGTVSGRGFTMRPYAVTSAGARALTALSTPSISLYAESGGTIALNAVTATTPFTNAVVFSNGSQNGALNSYTNGTYSRSWTATFATTTTHASNTIRGIVVGGAGFRLFGNGWAFLLDSPGFTKTDLQTCTITGAISWGRA